MPGAGDERRQHHEEGEAPVERHGLGGDGLHLLPHHRVAGRAGGLLGGAGRRGREVALRVVQADRPPLDHAQGAEVLDQAARALARDVGQQHVAGRLHGGARDPDDVAGALRAQQRVEDRGTEIMGDDDPEVDHRGALAGHGAAPGSQTLSSPTDLPPPEPPESDVLDGLDAPDSVLPAPFDEVPSPPPGAAAVLGGGPAAGAVVGVVEAGALEVDRRREEHARRGLAPQTSHLVERVLGHALHDLELVSLDASVLIDRQRSAPRDGTGRRPRGSGPAPIIAEASGAWHSRRECAKTGVDREPSVASAGAGGPRLPTHD